MDSLDMTEPEGLASSSEVRRRVRELSVLFEISQKLDETLDLEDVLGSVLEAMVEQMEMERAQLTLLNRQTREIVTEEAYGYSADEQERGRFDIGEGITGGVVESGEPRVIEKVSEAEEFLHRTKPRSERRAETSFICVPVRMETEVIGTLSAERLHSPQFNLDEDLRLMSIIASMVAQAVSLRRKAAEERQRLEEENARLHDKLKNQFRPDNIVGNSKEMLEVFDLIAQVAESSTSVLIQGESGTGKELIANAVHYNSPRADGAFIKVNCGALPRDLVESELFGHEKGAFTGAVEQREGRFELADSGTIFLDEVGDLPLAMQVKLLRVLQEGTLERVGGTETIEVDVRVIAATSRDLEALIEQDGFRRDLYYRLNVFPIHVPPLRDRKSDVLLLADHFVDEYNGVHGKEVRRISTPAIDMLHAYHWPGNVRELENCIERAVLLSQDGVIHGHQLPPSLQTAEASDTEFTGDLQSALDSLERELIIDALKTTRGNRAAAARKLDITERVMGLRVEKYDIDTDRFRE